MRNTVGEEARLLRLVRLDCLFHFFESKSQVVFTLFEKTTHLFTFRKKRHVSFYIAFDRLAKKNEKIEQKRTNRSQKAQHSSKVAEGSFGRATMRTRKFLGTHTIIAALMTMIKNAKQSNQTCREGSSGTAYSRVHTRSVVRETSCSLSFAQNTMTTKRKRKAK